MSQCRAGPWPGLTPRGAALLLACAIFLGVGQILVGPPTKPVPDLPVTAVTALLPLVVATRLVRAPGAASGVCGAYLLPASTIALLQPAVAPPPLLLVPAVVFDLALWIQATDVTALLPDTGRQWRKRSTARDPTTLRATLAGVVFGVVLNVVEVPFRLFLGGDPSAWSGANIWVAAVASALACGALARLLTFRGTAG